MSQISINDFDIYPKRAGIYGVHSYDVTLSSALRLHRKAIPSSFRCAHHSRTLRTVSPSYTAPLNAALPPFVSFCFGTGEADNGFVGLGHGWIGKLWCYVCKGGISCGVAGPWAMMRCMGGCIRCCCVHGEVVVCVCVTLYEYTTIHLVLVPLLLLLLLLGAGAR